MYKATHFDGYHSIEGVWDEMYLQNSDIRGHYQKVIDYLSNESPDELGKKEELAQRLFMKQGITLPFIIAGKE